MMHKLKQLCLAVKWQRQVRAAVSTQLSLLEHPSVFALGGLTDEETECLAELVQNLDATGGPVIEFGTLFGLTTLVLAAHKPPSVKCVTVDNFCWNPFGLSPALHRDFTQRILCTAIRDQRVELVDADSQTFRAGYQGPVPSMVFLDADHSYAAVKDEIRWAQRLEVPLICGHDYGNSRFQVTRAVNEAFSSGVMHRGMMWWVKP